MSSQHRNLAAVWDTLQGNHDIASLLREIIGQHSIDSSLQEDESRNIEESVRSIVWIKTIYDLQRCYLSGISTGLAGCPPYHLPCFLPSELLFSSILYLINVKTRLFSSQTTLMTREFTRSRHILAQTVLSGLRLLLLRKENLAAKDRRRLQTAINTAWQNDRLHGVEHFIVSGLFAATLDTVNEPDHVNPYQTEWMNARLPTFAAGLYPLDIRPETFITPLIHGTMEEDWLDAYWVLFDCLWAAECALIQRYVDLRRKSGVPTPSEETIETDEILEQIYHTRTSLIISVFHITGPMTPPPAMLESLAITLLDWNEDLDSFLSRQDSLLQQSASRRTSLTRNPSYGKQISEMQPYFEVATIALVDWLSSRKSGYEQFTLRKASVTTNDMQDMVEKWVKRMKASNAEAISSEVEGASLPVYVVNCPKLHVMPKKYLEYQLRWADKWAYESIQENSPIVNWKEGVQCPSCPSGEKIKTARLIEPIQDLSTALESTNFDNYSMSHYSVGDSGGSGSYDAASASAASRSTSEAESGGISIPSHSTMSMSLPSQASRIGTAITAENQGLPAAQPPRYTDSPISPVTLGPGPLSLRSQSYGSIFADYPVSPLTESLNIPIPLSVGSRLSMDLPIPVLTPAIPESIPENASTSTSALSDVSSIRGTIPSDLSSIRLNTASTNSLYSEVSVGKAKSTSRTVRIANSIRRKPTTKEKDNAPLPKEPSFVFSSSGHSLLLWGKGANHLVRFDIPSNDASSIQGCKYEAARIEAAAAGNHKCAIIAASGVSKKRLLIYDGINLQPAAETDLDFSGRLGAVCVAVSRDDKFVATSLNDDIQLYNVESGLKLVPFHHQIHVYELRGGISHKRTISVGRTTSDDSIADSQKTETGSWFGTQSRGLSSKEAAEEQQRNTAIISRQIYFSTDSKRLVVATQLGDHCVYVDVWDCTREPVSTISEHSRSFKLPPWTLNDGDLTGVFYDSNRRAALVTAFLSKEYPVLIPFPGYDTLQNETYSTKIVHGAQSPSGSTFIIANAMTEMIQFEYSSKGNLSPRKLKKSAGKISSSVFKPGAIALAMPLENCLQCFWIKDGKCILRNIKLGTGEMFKDYDIRPHYDRLMSLTNKPVIARAPSLMIPELDGSGFG